MNRGDLYVENKVLYTKRDEGAIADSDNTVLFQRSDLAACMISNRKSKDEKRQNDKNYSTFIMETREPKLC